MPSARFPRRRFLQAGTGTLGLFGIACSSKRRTYWRVLKDHEAATLGALCDQIIPEDDFPSATQAGVLVFIDRQLDGFYSNLRQDYSIGVNAIDRLAAKEAGSPFAELDLKKQLAILEALDAGKFQADGAAARSFFQMLVNHTMQGYYGSPRHGGNRERISWRMLGVPDPPVRGRLQYDASKTAGRMG